MERTRLGSARFVALAVLTITAWLVPGRAAAATGTPNPAPAREGDGPLPSAWKLEPNPQSQSATPTVPDLAAGEADRLRYGVSPANYELFLDETGGNGPLLEWLWASNRESDGMLWAEYGTTVATLALLESSFLMPLTLAFAGGEPQIPSGLLKAGWGLAGASAAALVALLIIDATDPGTIEVAYPERLAEDVGTQGLDSTPKNITTAALLGTFLPAGGLIYDESYGWGWSMALLETTLLSLGTSLLVVETCFEPDGSDPDEERTCSGPGTSNLGWVSLGFGLALRVATAIAGAALAD